MVAIEGNILTPTLNRQLIALQNTARALDAAQLQLASGKLINSALDNPQNFFASRSLENRSGDLARLLDGIGQSIRTIEVADNGVSAALKLINTAEAYVNELEQGFLSGDLPSLDVNTLITARIDEILATNPNAIDLGGGRIGEIYTATGSVTFTPPTGVTQVDYLVVGGGGGGGSSTFFSTAGSGGGGAGGVVEGTLNVNDSTNYTITVGAGGAAGPNGNNSGSNGNDSVFGSITGIGGGGGIGGNGNGSDGGSGGGGRGGVGGVALQPISLQGGLGSTGGFGPSPSGFGGGGGGGATLAGDAPTAIDGGVGGTGYTSSIVNTPLVVGGGGGGGGANADAFGTGGLGGGGDGANDGSAATAGAVNTGGGGGGGNNNRLGADGGSGIVALSYTLKDDTKTQEQLEYESILTQLDLLVIDADYRGIGLLNGDDLTTFFNEDRTSFLVTEGISASSDGLGLTTFDFLEIEDVQNALIQIRDARDSLRNFGQTLTNDINIIKNREIFTRSTVNTLENGSSDLVVADQNELGAQLLALQTRQALQFNILSLSAQQPSLALFS